jgi:acetyl-CoA carboxylase biotin carboxylase subunit
LDLKEIKELITLMRKNDLSVFKMEKEGFKITLKKGTDFQPVITTAAPVAYPLAKVLIANRGEIALRVIRACKELGVKTLAVYSEADVDSLHVQLADEAICIGPAPAQQLFENRPHHQRGRNRRRGRDSSRLRISERERPLRGRLRELQHQVHRAAGSAIRSMGDKKCRPRNRPQGRRAVTPGSDGIVETEQEALKIAKKIGYPVMIKAVAGGGGRGMRPAHNDGALVQGFTPRAWKRRRRSATPAFTSKSSSRIRTTSSSRSWPTARRGRASRRARLLDAAAQPEDHRGTPSPIMTDAPRKMGADCVNSPRKSATSAPAPSSASWTTTGNYYFMEMNTRIQVEHCITEEAYGVDLVKEQIKIAAGEPLSHWMHDAKRKYHAIECRINAEDPFNNFQPSPGKIDLYYAPGGRGVRIDSHAYAGYTVPPHYDSMIAKVIAMGTTRDTPSPA